MKSPSSGDKKEILRSSTSQTRQQADYIIFGAGEQDFSRNRLFLGKSSVA